MKERIVRHSKDALKKIKGRTSFKRVGETSDKEIEEQVKNDPDLVLPTDEELKELKPVKRRKMARNKIQPKIVRFSSKELKRRRGKNQLGKDATRIKYGKGYEV